MESKDLRQFVLAKIVEKKGEFDKLVEAVKDFCIRILVDCKVVMVELDSVKKIASLAIDEIDDRTNSGLLEPIDSPIAKGLLDKILFNTPWGVKLEAWYKDVWQKALDIIGKETTGISEK